MGPRLRTGVCTIDLSEIIYVRVRPAPSTGYSLLRLSGFRGSLNGGFMFKWLADADTCAGACVSQWCDTVGVLS